MTGHCNRRAFLKTIAGASLYSATATCASLQREPSQQFRNSIQRAIASDIKNEIAAGRLTGVALALVQDGRICWEEGFGWADREAQRIATASTPFSLASTTKTFTTSAMMMLVEKGQLRLDTPVNQYLAPDRLFDDKGLSNTATLRQAASHSAGVPTFFLMYPENEPVTQPSVSQILRDYGHLVARPGEHYEYSNLGMAIIAEVVARRSGIPFGLYLRDRILRPLGMVNSFFDTEIARRPEMAARYSDDGAKLPFYLTATPGSGEMYASAHDLAIWALFHLQKINHPRSVLSTPSLEELHRPQIRIDPSTAYGLGWMISQQSGADMILHHAGGQSGVRVEFVLLPQYEVAAIVLSNRHSNQPFIEGIRDQLLRAIVPSWTGIPKSQDDYQVWDPAYFGMWEGRLSGQGRMFPVHFVITDANKATMAVQNQIPRPIDDFALSGGWLSGTATGTIDAPDALRENLHNIDLNLCLRGDVIDGELIAWSKSGSRMAVLPYWTTFSRRKMS